MVLTNKNLKSWKKQLNKDAKKCNFDVNLSETLSDEEWLVDYIGEDTEDVVRNEIFYSL